MSFQEYLLLIVDEDRKLYTLVSDSPALKGVRVVFACNFDELHTILKNQVPSLIVVDFKIACFDGYKTLRSLSESTQILLTGYPKDAEIMVQSDFAASFDFIIKPFQSDLFSKKILMHLRGARKADEKSLLDDELSSFDSVYNGISATYDTDKLLNEIFRQFLYISKAEKGYLQLFDKDEGELVVVRQSGEDPLFVRNAVANCSEIKNISLISSNTAAGNDRDCKENEFSLRVPLKVHEDLLGVVTLKKETKAEPFSNFEMQRIEMFAAHAGSVLYHANHYNSVNQKLDDLMLISTYSEQLMGLVDKYDVIRSLFEISFRHFPIDFLGFLLIQRRTHEFLYWSRGNVDEKILKNICKDSIEQFNQNNNTHIHERRVLIRKLPVQIPATGEFKASFGFTHTLEVCWDDYKFGSVLFLSNKEIPNESEKKTMLSSLVSQTRIALTNSKLYSDMKENYIRTIKALAIAVDAKDTYTHGHSENVMNIAEEIARQMGIDEKGIGIIRDAGLLHDIGKIGIPGYILNKPGPLTHEEFNGIMKTHSTLGANIVKDVPFLRDLHKLILYHHENYDGGGYPENLKGEQIPIGARILHVADAFEAMTSNRPYRNSLGKKEAIKRLVENSGKQFDPTVIKAFVNMAIKKGWVEEMYIS